MNVYDFDDTIYSGESVFDFYIFCLKRYPSLIRFLFIILASWMRYKLLLLSRERLMFLAGKYARSLIKTVGNVEDLVEEFWDQNQHKIKKFYLNTQKEDDVIVSASLGFLLRDICGRLGIKHLICTEVDTHSGEIFRLCFRQNKPVFFEAAFPGQKIDNFFSDSMNDLPMMQLAENAYLVHGEKLIPVSKEKLQ